MIIEKLKGLLNPKGYSLLIKYSLNYRSKLALIVLTQVLFSLSGVGTAIITKNLIDNAIAGNINNALIFGLLLALIMFISLFISNYVQVFTAKVRESMKNNIQIDLLKGVFHKQWMSLHTFKSGDLLTRLNVDVLYIIDVWISVVPSLVALIIQLITAYIVLSRFDSTLAFLAFIITPITFFPGLIIGTKLKTIQQKIQQAESTLNSFVNESIHSLNIIKAFNIENKNISLTGRFQDERRNFIVKKSKTSAAANFILGLGYQIGFFAALAFGAFRLSTDTITFGTFTAFLQLVSQIQYPIDGLSRTIPQIITSLSSVERLNEINELPYDLTETETESYGHLTIDRISIENVNFEYNKSAPVLRNFNLDIKPGERIALIGPSGEGKTTLAMILLGFLSPQKGSINIIYENGSILPVSSATRKLFSYVPQNNSLFSGTIGYNLLLANENATKEDIDKALEASCAKQFIQELPDGLNTIVGEKGLGLSEGQIQRICIARALLRNSAFLILDEATSALDMESERLIILGLKEYYPEKTIIAITHRESILEICNKVCLLKKEKIA